MKTNPLLQLREQGQSFWLDNLTRTKLRDGELARRVEEEGLGGVTSNPAIFDKAFSGKDGYDEQIEKLAARGLGAREIYETIAVQDVQSACDVLRQVYDETEGRDGFVSLEVSPYLAYDSEATLRHARHLNGAVARPNVMIKIPATEAGLPVIEEALYEGINVNITLLFSVRRYGKVARAYLQALERRLAAGRTVHDVASVASFFLSRIDVMTDRLLSYRLKEDGGAEEGDPGRLFGRAALASARRAYELFGEIFGGERWREMEDAGARVQRLLWASTSNKNPLCDDLRYVEPLIAPHTVNTMPDRTASEFRRRGRVARTLEAKAPEADRVISDLADLGIDVEDVADRLEAEGVQKFVDPFDDLLGTLARRLPAPDGVDALTAGVVDVEGLLDDLQERRFAARVFSRDSSLWSDDPDDRDLIRSSLGWLDAPDTFLERLDEIQELATDLREEGFEDVVLVGMGGSSGTAWVALDVFGGSGEGPRFHVLDDVDPEAVGRLEDELDWSTTFVIVASKSGTTAETLSLYHRFFARVRDRVDADAGHRFAAVTDADTPLAKEAEERGFRRVFVNPPDIGGRYSALSYFGLVPMAILGADIEAVLRSAIAMRNACGPEVPARLNPAVRLGGLLGALAARGHDKMTFTFSPETRALGPWIRQLLAESTGKDGTGIVPVLDEPSLPPERYSKDHTFVHLPLANGHGAIEEDQSLSDLAKHGHPVLRVLSRTAEQIGGELMRWELATAVAGAVLGVNAFDQPNVESTKRIARELLDEPESQSSVGVELASANGISLFGGRPNEDNGSGTPTKGRETNGSRSSAQALDPVQASLEAFLGQAREGDYIALLPFFHKAAVGHQALQTWREGLEERFGVPTTLGYGPAYLHSTGQLHKGGPNSGLFVVLTADEAAESGASPDQGEGNDVEALHRAQPLADFRSLEEAGRRVVRLHLHGGVARCLHALAVGSSSWAYAAEAQRGTGSEQR